MESCEGACCGNAPRRVVSDLFDRGYRRNRLDPFALNGAELHDANDLTARFSLDLANGAIKGIRFRVSTCITLIAYCELIVELVAGKTAREAASLSESELVAALPDVHAMKRDRARLAINAFRAPLASATHVQTGEAA
jgi:NifU-like protein involved in Fe-S cluster formation